MGGGIKPKTKKKKCKYCGKNISGPDLARHLAMHREKSKEKQTKLK